MWRDFLLARFFWCCFGGVCMGVGNERRCIERQEACAWRDGSGQGVANSAALVDGECGVGGSGGRSRCEEEREIGEEEEVDRNCWNTATEIAPWTFRLPTSGTSRTCSDGGRATSSPSVSNFPLG